jgi:hypothetical protein
MKFKYKHDELSLLWEIELGQGVFAPRSICSWFLWKCKKKSNKKLYIHVDILCAHEVV